MRQLSRSELKLWRRYSSGAAALTRALNHQLRQDADMSQQEFAVLSALSNEQASSLRMSKLADGVFMSPSRLTHTVERMENRGWVTRINDPEDARVRMASLTSEGRHALEKAWQGHSQRIGELFLTHVSASDRNTLEAIFTTIEKAARAAVA